MLGQAGSLVLWFRWGSRDGFFLGVVFMGFSYEHCVCGIYFLFPMTHLAYVMGDFVKYTLYCSVICFYKVCYIDFIFLVKVNFIV